MLSRRLYPWPRVGGQCDDAKRPSIGILLMFPPFVIGDHDVKRIVVNALDKLTVLYAIPAHPLDTKSLSLNLGKSSF